MRMTSDLNYFRMYSDVVAPFKATTGSACFDLYSYLPYGMEVKVYRNTSNGELEIDTRTIDESNPNLLIHPNERVLVPTGLIFDIPSGHSVRLYPRSSLALKRGLTLANNVGIIDSDYVDPVFVMLVSLSRDSVSIDHGERICQAEVVQDYPVVLSETGTRPTQKTERDGGFGSTGSA